jgi:O-antigen ligase
MIERAAWILLCAFVFSLPWEKTVLLSGFGTASRLLGVVAFAAGVAAAARRKSLRGPNLALVLAGCFAAWTSMTWFWSVAPEATALRAATMVQLFAMAWLIWDQCRSGSGQRQLMAAYVAGSSIASISTLVRYAQEHQTYYRRYAAAGFDPNDLGLTVALVVPMALYLALRQKGPGRWLSYAAVALAIAAVLLTASRSALVATCLGFVFAACTWRQAGTAHRIASVALAVSLGLGIVWLAPEASRDRLSTLPGELSGGTFHNRTRIWKAGLKVFRHRPVAGVGAGAYPQAVFPLLGRPALAGHEYVAHNTFLSVMVECGAIGLAIYGLMLGVLAVFVWVMPPIEGALWATMLAVWTTGVFTLSWEHRKPGWLLFALIMTAWARSFAAPGKAEA